MRFLLLIFFSFLLTSCNPRVIDHITSQVTQQASVVVETVREITEDEVESGRPSGSRRSPTISDRRTSCNSPGYEDGPEVVLGELDYIDSSNAGKYKLSGRCSEENKPIYVEVNGHGISNNPLCNKKRWEVFLNLTTISSEKKEVSFEISHGEDSNIVCEDVRVAFSCPKNYVPVSPVEESRYYPKHAFCVMKYEAKLAPGKGKAISVPEGRPLTRIAYSQALDLCRVNGSRYDLMSNEQWQVLAHNIELQHENWSKNTHRIVNGNVLNCGVSVGTIRSASSNDEDSCAENKCKPDWDYKKRTHVLPNNYLIWDVCGNAAELMKGQSSSRSRRSKVYNDYNDYVYRVSYGDIKNDFGPKRIYRTAGDNHSRNKYWGLGFIKTNRNGDLIVRGQQGRHAGVFSAHLDKRKDNIHASSSIGFRCVYVP